MKTHACVTCGAPLANPPMCYGAEAPYRILGVSDADFSERVELNDDLCVVDERVFLIRGHIDLPVIGSSEPFTWSVWCSLSEPSFLHVNDRWNCPERSHDPPYFGWLMTALPPYPSTLHLKTHVQTREVGMVPLVILEATDHPLAIEQRKGITLARIAEFAHLILHEGGAA